LEVDMLLAPAEEVGDGLGSWCAAEVEKDALGAATECAVLHDAAADADDDAKGPSVDD